MTYSLTPFQEALLLSVCPEGTHILSAHPHRTVQLPCPIHVSLALPTGEERRLILRMTYIRDGVEKEAAVLPVLAKLGLPVPEVLAGPVLDPAQPEVGPMTILSVLPGQDFLTWGRQATSEQLVWAMDAILSGIARLHAVTELLSHEPVAQLLPQKTLCVELQTIITQAGPWFNKPIFRLAVDILSRRVATIQTPLAFSSGDYNQGNFLFKGQELTGLLDFAEPCFEDPHIGMAMYWIHCWNPFDRAGIVERYLEQHQLTFVDFAPRLMLRCLRTLQERFPVRGGDDVHDVWGFESQADSRERILKMLQRALEA
jgi:aminoglycoside phosphotransferase (APT) family kinase protein